jgi:TPR repeat protein
MKMDTHTAEKLVADAEAALNTVGCEAAYKLIEPLLAEGNPAALFLYSHFSFSELETEEEFDKRRIEMLRRAAGLGYAPALHALGVCYDTGDLVEGDPSYAATLLKAAAEKGHPKAKFLHGLNLFYASNGMHKDEELGLQLIRDAAQEGVEEAQEYLKGHGLA